MAARRRAAWWHTLGWDLWIMESRRSRRPWANGAILLCAFGTLQAAVDPEMSHFPQTWLTTYEVITPN